MYAYMLLCMRTTIDISDHLAVHTRKLAAERHTSLKALVEEGLQLVILGQQSGYESAAKRLKGLGKHLWDDVEADAYVREQREGWGS